MILRTAIHQSVSCAMDCFSPSQVQLRCDSRCLEAAGPLRARPRNHQWSVVKDGKHPFSVGKTMEKCGQMWQNDGKSSIEP